jgi:pyridoxamine 5'-phosphate oxidase family protein
MRRTTALTAIEREYLGSQEMGRLATTGPDGAPDVVPVGYVLNPDGSLDIGGPRMGETRKFRNVIAHPRVAFVIDDRVPDEPGPFRPGIGRGIELRGRAEALRDVDPPPYGPPGFFSREVIRIHPDQILSWHLDPDTVPLEVLRGNDHLYRQPD